MFLCYQLSRDFPSHLKLAPPAPTHSINPILYLLPPAHHSTGKMPSSQFLNQATHFSAARPLHVPFSLPSTLSPTLHTCLLVGTCSSFSSQLKYHRFKEAPSSVTHQKQHSSLSVLSQAYFISSFFRADTA